VNRRVAIGAILGSMTHEAITVSIPIDTSPDEFRAIESAWREDLIDDVDVPRLSIEASMTHRADPTQVAAWAAVITASGSALKIFLDAIAARTGEAVGEVLAKRIRALGKSRKKDTRRTEILYRDEETGVTAILSDELEPAAVEVFLDLELDEFERDPISWDPKTKRWVPPS
jgi:hypothetical protein